MSNMRSDYGKIIVSVAIITIIAFALIVFAVLPLLSKIEQGNVDIQSNRQKIAQISAEIESHKRLEVQFRKVEIEHELLSGMFPTREDLVVLVQGLENAVNRSALAHALILNDPDPSASGSAGNPAAEMPVAGLQGIEEISYSLEFETGTYRQFVDFLLYLENQPFITRLQNLTLSAALIQGDGSQLRSTGVATAEIEGKFFVSDSK